MKSNKKIHGTKKEISVTLIMTALLTLSVLAALKLGSVEMSFREFFQALFRSGDNAGFSLIIHSVRIPRVLGALIAGVGLSVSGLLLQSVTDNGLAGPNVIGVNAGAGFATVAVLFFLPSLSPLLPLWAFVGAFAATFLIVCIAGAMKNMRMGVILAGVAITALLNAAISFLNLLNSDVLVTYNAFSVGGVAGVLMEDLLVPGVTVAICLVLVCVFWKKIRILCLGDLTAASLGVNVRFLRVFCMVCASASAGAVVSFAGLLGFVGLIIPHVARKAVGDSAKALPAVCALSGAILVILADLVGRTLFAPTEIPVGIMMAVVGAPFFLILALTRRSAL